MLLQLNQQALKDNQKPQSDYRQRTDSRERSNRDKQAKNTQKEFQVVKKQEAKAENTQAKQRTAIARSLINNPDIIHRKPLTLFK